MAWAPQLKGKKLEEQQDLRARFAADPDSLTAAERERAEGEQGDGQRKQKTGVHVEYAKFITRRVNQAQPPSNPSLIDVWRGRPIQSRSMTW